MMNQFKIFIFLGLFAVLSSFQNPCHASSADSLGLESLEGKTFIIHKVDAGQTVYAIARKYKAKVADIYTANPGLKENGLKVGNIVKIPYEQASVTQTTTNFTPSSTPSASNSSSSAVSGKIHTVEKGQTLFAIARQYKVSVADIKKWNNLEGNDVKLGQQLKVGEEDASTSSATASADPNAIPMTSSVSIGPSGYKKITETGKAELNDVSDPISKYRAWHKSAPYGTILLVTNEITGAYVFVRVVGNGMEGNSKNTVLRLSREAWEKIAPDTKPLKVKVEYTP